MLRRYMKYDIGRSIPLTNFRHNRIFLDISFKIMNHQMENNKQLTIIKMKIHLLSVLFDLKILMKNKNIKNLIINRIIIHSKMCYKIFGNLHLKIQNLTKTENIIRIKMKKKMFIQMRNQKNGMKIIIKKQIIIILFLDLKSFLPWMILMILFKSQN